MWKNKEYEGLEKLFRKQFDVNLANMAFLVKLTEMLRGMPDSKSLIGHIDMLLESNQELNESIKKHFENDHHE